MDNLAFSPIEKSVSFYTRNDFAILNSLLMGDYDALWRYALLAYRDNRGIIDEFEQGERTVAGEYEVKWLNCLKERLVDSLDDNAKRRIVQTAKSDISNILGAMVPTDAPLSLFRTAWGDRNYARAGTYPYSREYQAVEFAPGGVFEVKTISSCSRTTYREEDDTGSGFCRYEIHVPAGKPVLQLDQFVTHNEDGEILLPPMRCIVTGICGGEKGRCQGIIGLEYAEPLP